MTPPGRECELKLRLGGRRDFERLLALPGLDGGKRLERQTNHYFDTASRELARARAMLRIRDADGATLTLKCGAEVAPGRFDALEFESPLSPTTRDAAVRDPRTLLELPLPPVAELRRRFGSPPLVRSGSLSNERHYRRGPAGLLLEIDHLRLPDGNECFELEVEIDPSDTPAAERLVRDSLDRIRVSWEPQRLTKQELLLRHSAAGDGRGEDAEGIG